MANAKKCDRCGKLYEEGIKVGIKNVQVTKIKIVPKYKEKIEERNSFDLCDDCAEVLDMWLKNEKKSIVDKSRNDEIKKMNETNSIILFQFLKTGKIPTDEEIQKEIQEEQMNEPEMCKIFGVPHKKAKRTEDDNAEKIIDITIDAGPEDEDEDDSWD